MIDVFQKRKYPAVAAHLAIRCSGRLTSSWMSMIILMIAAGSRCMLRIGWLEWGTLKQGKPKAMIGS
jgi:hypothetical protein